MLLEKVEHDLIAARLAVADGRAADVACFLAQQAVEKSLRALLAARGIGYPRTHDLEALFVLAEPHVPDLASVRESALPLSLYATDLRYGELPEPEPGLAEAEAALAAATRVFEIVAERLGGLLGAAEAGPA